MLLMAHRPQGEGSMFDPANPAGYSPSFPYAARQSAGQKRPCDMDSLKMAISIAVPGTGQVKRAITDATFQPRAPAFTSLIQTCAKFRQVQKAIEVFDTMANSEAIDVKPNTVHYRQAFCLSSKQHYCCCSVSFVSFTCLVVTDHLRN